MPTYVPAQFQVLSYTPNALQMIERAGRTCYKSEDRITDDSADKFVRMLIKRGHESVIEHAIATVLFVVDRGVSHEMVRHRLCSFSQESTRFCDYNGKGIVLIHPPGLLPYQVERREAHFWDTQRLYDTERAEGVKPEIARGVLPTCLKTEMVWTCNLREWRYVFTKRAAIQAHPQMREVMFPLLDVFKKMWPPIYEDLLGDA